MCERGHETAPAFTQSQLLEGLAQALAPYLMAHLPSESALHAGGQGFKSPRLHHTRDSNSDSHRISRRDLAASPRRPRRAVEPRGPGWPADLIDKLTVRHPRPK